MIMRIACMSVVTVTVLYCNWHPDKLNAALLLNRWLHFALLSQSDNLYCTFMESLVDTFGISEFTVTHTCTHSLTTVGGSAHQQTRLLVTNKHIQ